jgi:hypothetical protein
MPIVQDSKRDHGPPFESPFDPIWEVEDQAIQCKMETVGAPEEANPDSGNQYVGSEYSEKDGQKQVETLLDRAGHGRRARRCEDGYQEEDSSSDRALEPNI